MYGDCQVLMSLLPSTMGGMPATPGENTMMIPSSNNIHHHHHHGHGHGHHQMFLSPPPPPLRLNPNSTTTPTLGFNFMDSSIPNSFQPFPSYIPTGEQQKEDQMSVGSGMITTMLGLRGGCGGSASKDEVLDSHLELDGGFSGGNNVEDISTGTQYLFDQNNNSSQQQNQSLVSGGGGGGGGGNNKKKRYHRHTARQIQELEAMFKECPHPDEKQRLRLSQELGLKPTQVKFWFQNRRTQMKAQHDRADNMILRSENDSLKTENYKLGALMRSLMCPNCGNSSILGEVACDEHQLRHENARLKEELDQLCMMVSRYSGSSRNGPFPALVQSDHHQLQQHHHVPSLDLDMNIYSRGHFQEPPQPPSDHGNQMAIMPMSYPPDHGHYYPPPAGAPLTVGVDEILLSDDEKPLAMELAMSSLQELLKMGQTDEPLWVRNNDNIVNSLEVLNVEEYARMTAVKGGDSYLRREATRHSALVIMNSVNLVEAFLDAEKWIELFPSIVSRAKTIQVVVASDARRSLHLMYAEMQVVSPLVPTRETYFLRYCHHNTEDGMWVIVDFPVDDNFRFSRRTMLQNQRYRRRPSGCIIQDMPNGYSKVTWVEHGEILEEKPVQPVFNNYVTSGMAYSATRWLAVLQRQCERVASQMARNISDIGVIQSAEARKNLMRLSHRMTRLFCVNMSCSGGQSWTSLPDSAEETVRITTRQVTEPGQPIGVILCAALTKRLPYSADHVFNFLKNEHNRSRLEAFSHGNLHEVAHIANGSDPGNSVSLLRINVASNSSQNVDLMLQETCTDTSNRLIVYTTVQVNYIQQVMAGHDPSTVPLLPVGFSITPLKPQQHSTTTLDDEEEGRVEEEGCLLTVGLQAHASAVPTAKVSLSSIAAMNDHLCSAVSQINAALLINAASTSSTITDSGRNVIKLTSNNHNCAAPGIVVEERSGGECLHAHQELTTATTMTPVSGGGGSSPNVSR